MQQLSEVNSTQSPVNSVIKIRSRIVYSNVCTHNCSANWRADLAMHTGRTYALVLKSRPRNQNPCQNSFKQVKHQHKFNKHSVVAKHQMHAKNSNKSDSSSAKNHVKYVKGDNYKVVPRLDSKDIICNIELSNRFLPISPNHDEHEAGNHPIENIETKNKADHAVKK